MRICYRVIWTETDWRNLANRSVPDSITVVPNDGYGKDLDSTGLYQQRASQGWGSIVGSMSPYVATQRFLTAMLRDVPDWYGVDESTVCQLTQRSQYDGRTVDPGTGKPYLFAANYQARTSQVNLLEVDPFYFSRLP